MGGDYAVPAHPDGSSGGSTYTPFYVRLTPLNDEPLTFDPAVRIVAGSLYDDFAGMRDFCDAYYGGMTPLYEIKHHTVTYSRIGGLPNWFDGNSFHHILVFDTATGEHCIIEMCEWKGVSRPRILTDKNGSWKWLTHIKGKKLNSFNEIDKLIP